MAVAENVALMRRWFEEVWNQGRVETVYELCDERTVGMGLAEQGSETRGPEEYVRYLQRLRGAFPDIRITVEDAFGADDKVAVRWSADMTHAGGQLGVPPTRNRVQVTGITIVRMENGKIAQGWNNWDQLAMMERIEARPPASAKLRA